MAFSSPLRYPGGKGKLTRFIKYILLQNTLTGGSYVEPYAGGAGIACELLLSQYVRRIVINDADAAVWAFWECLINHTEALCQRIYDTPVNMDTWYQQKEVQNAVDPDILDLGFSTFFLNRTNRSGILRGGVIGGLNQDGNFLIDARFNKQALIGRINNIANYRDRIELYNLDAIAFLDIVQPQLTVDDLVYFDPPYYVKGQGLYRNFYNEADHADIAARIHDLNIPWIVSYDNVIPIRNLYPDARNLIYDISYSAETHYFGREIIFFSDNLQIPELQSPLEVTDKAIRDFIRNNPEVDLIA